MCTYNIKLFILCFAAMHTVYAANSNPPPYLSGIFSLSPPPPNIVPTCFDSIQNNDETGIDCGGSCLFSCSNLVPCTYSNGPPRSTYSPSTVNTEDPFMQIVYPSFCSIFKNVPATADNDFYLFDGLAINIYGSYNNVTKIQYNVPQPGYGEVIWDFTASPAQWTIYANGSKIHSSLSLGHRKLMSNTIMHEVKRNRILLQQGLPPGACMTSKQCVYMSALIGAEAAITCLLFAAFPGAAIPAGIVCAIFAAGLSTYCTAIECDKPCSELQCLPGLVPSCANAFCTICQCNRAP